MPRGAVIGALVPLLGACQQIDYIDLQPSPVVLKHKTDTVWLQAHPMSHTGVYYARAPVAFEVKDPSIATVDVQGKVAPVSSGATEVVAKSGQVRATVSVEVLYPERLKVEPNPLALEEGQSPLELTVHVYDYVGRELRDRTPIFHALDAEVLSMGQNAAFPVNAGKTVLEVSVGDLLEKVPVTVEAKGKRAK